MWQRCLAYRRRWGRLAWHVANLSRSIEMPELHELTGEEPAGGREQTEEQMLHSVRLWAAALKAKGANDDG